MSSTEPDIADIQELRKVIAECAFALESVAHLHGQERLLLPIAERARSQQNKLDQWINNSR